MLHSLNFLKMKKNHKNDIYVELLKEKKSFNHLKKKPKINYKTFDDRLYPHMCLINSHDFLFLNKDLLSGNEKFCIGYYGDYSLAHAWLDIDGNIIYDGVFNDFYDKEGITFHQKLILVKEKSIKEFFNDHEKDNHRLTPDDQMAYLQYQRNRNS